MSDLEIYSEFHSLPENLKKQVADFIKSLKSKNKKTHKSVRQFGILKGQIKISPDFDAPLDDFNEYMK